MRTIVASITTAKTSPSPNWRRASTRPKTNPENATAHNRGGRRDHNIPSARARAATASLLSPVSLPATPGRATRGRPRSPSTVRRAWRRGRSGPSRRPGRRRRPAGRRRRRPSSTLSSDRLEREDDRAEGADQDEERDQQDGENEPAQCAVRTVQEVDALRRNSADVRRARRAEAAAQKRPTSRRRSTNRRVMAAHRTRGG